MQAYNLTGGGTYPIYSGTSNTATVTVVSGTDVLSSDTSAPTLPTGLVATKDAYNEVDLKWTQASDNVGVTGYYVYRSRNAQWTILGHVSGTTYADLTVSASTAYYYAVKAYDAAGNIGATSTTLFLNTPAAPTIDTATTTTTVTSTTTATSIGVTVSTIFGSSYCEGLTAKTPLTFSASPYGGAYFSLAMVSPTSTSGTMAPGTYTLPNGSYRWNTIAYLGYTLSGTTSGDFILSFSCANTATTTNVTTSMGNTTTTPTVIATTTTIPAGTLPAVPSNLRVRNTPTATAIPLEWNDNSSIEDKYNVERKLTTESNYFGTRLVQLSANTTSYTDTNVVAATAYDYRVQACLSGYGCSAYVYLIGVKTAPTPVVTTPTATTEVVQEQITTSNTTVTTATAPTAPSADTITTTGQYTHYCDDPAHKIECQTYAATQVVTPIAAPVVPTVTADTFTVLQSSGALPAGASTPQELRLACTQTQYAASCADLFVASGVSDRTSADKVMDQALALQAETEKILSSRIGARAFLDTDNDGITDYDEVNIYRTDPKKTDTNGDGVSDGAQLLAGTDPLAKVLPSTPPTTSTGKPSVPPVKATSTGMIATQQKIAYEDPKFAGDIKSRLLAVTDVAGITTKAEDVTDTAMGEKKATTTKVKLEGKALPNSFVTIFVYSEPIVVTVKTDASGSWTYTLDKELSDGNHEVYSAITDVGGRILAKSEPLPFVKTAAAVSFGSAILLPAPAEQAPGFFSGGSLYALLAILVGILGVVFLLIGWMTRRNTPAITPGVIDEQKNDQPIL
jgi:hypothetical protein